MRCLFPDIVSSANVSGQDESTLYDPGECYDKCSIHRFELVDQLDDEQISKERKERCAFKGRNVCIIRFEYGEHINIEQGYLQVRIMVECFKYANMWLIAAYIVGAIAVIGLAVVLIGRCLLYLKDKRDYDRWIAEVEQSKQAFRQMGLNPLFQEATTEYRNPAYNEEEAETSL